MFLALKSIVVRTVEIFFQIIYFSDAEQSETNAIRKTLSMFIHLEFVILGTV